MNFQSVIELFVLGFIVGYVWNPLWASVKKIWSEAKKAKKEW